MCLQVVILIPANISISITVSQPIVITRMPRYILLLLLADATYYMVGCSSRRCKKTRVPPKVTVADSDHLRVNWKVSFVTVSLGNSKCIIDY